MLACQKQARFFDAKSLYLEVSLNGRKRWFWKYNFGGREKRILLGYYPEVSLVDARASREIAKEALIKGIDPVDDRFAARFQGETQSKTFEQIARQWHEQWRVSRSERHAGYVIRRLETDVFPALGSRPIGLLTAPQFVRLARDIEGRGASDIAKRMLQTCGQIMRYAVTNGDLERSPTADIRPGDILNTPRATNFARVGIEEFPMLLRAIATYSGYPATRVALNLVAYTFVRTQELIGARWSEFDLPKRVWTIPPERMKAKRAHHVPLSRQVMTLLLGLREQREKIFRHHGFAISG